MEIGVALSVFLKKKKKARVVAFSKKRCFRWSVLFYGITVR